MIFLLRILGSLHQPYERLCRSVKKEMDGTLFFGILLHLHAANIIRPLIIWDS
jgi:hypothetical protein